MKTHPYLTSEALDRLLMERLLQIVEEEFMVSRRVILSRSRKLMAINARMTFMYLAYTLGLGCQERVGEMIGRDHSTVINALTKIPVYMETEPPLRRKVTRWRARFKEEATQSGGTSAAQMGGGTAS